MKHFFGKKSRSALAMVLIISLGLHVVAIVVFGTIKFVSDALREEQSFESVEIAPPPLEKPDYTVNLKQRNESTPPPRPPAIVINKASELDIPTLDINVDVNSSSVYGRGGGGFGSGLKGIRQMAVTADIFGMEITSENLGVVLDVSGSAHATLDKAITEIDKNFPSAYMVLVVGCGMSKARNTPSMVIGQRVVPGKPRIVPYSKRSREKKYNAFKRSVPMQLEDFFGKIGSKRSRELRRYFEGRKNLYILYGGDIHAANFAFDFVLDKKVDTIYWFADFEDRIDRPVISQLTRQLRRKRTEVIAHNFLGRPVKKEVKEMVDKVGGKTLELIPGKQ